MEVRRSRIKTLLQANIRVRRTYLLKLCNRKYYIIELFIGYGNFVEYMSLEFVRTYSPEYFLSFNLKSKTFPVFVGFFISIYVYSLGPNTQLKNITHVAYSCEVSMLPYSSQPWQLCEVIIKIHPTPLASLHYARHASVLVFTVNENISLNY